MEHLRVIVIAQGLAPRQRLGDPALDALEQSLFVDPNLYRGVETDLPLRQHAVERGRLRHSAGKAVKDEAFAGIRFFDALGNDPDDHVVGHKAAAGHNFLCLKADRRTGLNRSAKHISCGELDNAVFGDEMLGLRAFASPRRAQQYQSHLRRPPLSFDLFIRPSYWCASR